MKVAVIYPYVAHYRRAIFRQLLASTRHEYQIIADDRQHDASVPKWNVEDRDRFTNARGFYMGRLFIQPYLLALPFKEFDCLIYLATPYSICVWASAALARLFGKRVLFWAHGWTREDTGLVRVLRKWFFKLADGILLYGNVAKRIAIKEGFHSARLYVVYNSLDYDTQVSLRAAFRREDLLRVRKALFPNSQDPILIYTGRLTRKCALDLLLKAQHNLRNRGCAINVLLVGDGPERVTLENAAARAHLPVVFYGPCYDEKQLAELIASADATVCPGRIGLSAMHSLAYGVPVITQGSWQGQMPEWEAIVPGHNGDHFREGDANDLAAVIERWIASGPRTADRIHACTAIIDQYYNPLYQVGVFNRAIEGQPPVDERWRQMGVPA